MHANSHALAHVKVAALPALAVVEVLSILAKASSEKRAIFLIRLPSFETLMRSIKWRTMT